MVRSFPPLTPRVPNVYLHKADEFPLFSENSDVLILKARNRERGTNCTLFSSFVVSTFIVIYVRGLMQVTLALVCTFLKVQILGFPVLLLLSLEALSTRLSLD